MTSQPVKQTITIHTLPNESKGMKERQPANEIWSVNRT